MTGKRRHPRPGPRKREKAPGRREEVSGEPSAAPQEKPDIVYGIRAVMELLEGAPERVSRLHVLEGSRAPAVQEMVTLARAAKIPFDFSERGRLNDLAGTDKHQGVVAGVAPFAYAELDDVLTRAAANPPGLVLVLDGVEDPRNLGAVVRTLEAAGGHGIIIPKRRAASVTATVAKAAAGALMHLPVCRVENVARTLETLKKAGFWVYGMTADGKQALNGADFSGPVALVLGAEGKGIRPLVEKGCDALVHIPLKGKTPSLNVSVAAAVGIFAVLAGRER